MTTVFKDKAKCPVCGEEFSYNAMGSTNRFGSMDLDTRPPEMYRSSMCYWLLECPACGYIASDMEKPSPVDRAFLESESYKNCDGYSFKNNLSEDFYRHYLIMKEAGKQMGACIALLHTVWTCDDGNDDHAKNLRALLVQAFESLPDSEYDENIDILKADVLRRSAQFEKLLSEYKDKHYDNDLLNKIVRFQLHKAEANDTGCYTVQDAIDYCAGL